MLLLVEWRYAQEDSGALFVMTPGITMMLKWSADNWDIQALVLNIATSLEYCMLLDMFSSGAVACSAACFGQGNGSIILDNVGCSGNESTLLSCPHRGIRIHNCGHHEDAGVRCSGVTCIMIL